MITQIPYSLSPVLFSPQNLACGRCGRNPINRNLSCIIPTTTAALLPLIFSTTTSKASATNSTSRKHSYPNCDANCWPNCPRDLMLHLRQTCIYIQTLHINNSRRYTSFLKFRLYHTRSAEILCAFHL